MRVAQLLQHNMEGFGFFSRDEISEVEEGLFDWPYSPNIHLSFLVSWLQTLAVW